MLNEEKIRLMTKLAIYEKHEEKSMVQIRKYFQSDYVSFQVLKTVISVTIAYVIVVGIWFLYNFEYMLSEIYRMDLLELAKRILIGYGIVLFIYVLISIVIYVVRYRRGREKIKKYGHYLKAVSYTHLDVYKRQVL